MRIKGEMGELRLYATNDREIKLYVDELGRLVTQSSSGTKGHHARKPGKRPWEEGWRQTA